MPCSVGGIQRTPADRTPLSRLLELIAVRLALSLAFIAAITFICVRLIHVNPTTVGFAYLVGILIIAAAAGLLEASGVGCRNASASITSSFRQSAPLLLPILRIG